MNNNLGAQALKIEMSDSKVKENVNVFQLNQFRNLYIYSISEKG